MDIAILLYDDLAALDAVGPYQVLASMPGATVKMVAAEAGPKRTSEKSLAMVADYAVEEVPSPDIIVIPGGSGEVAAKQDPRVLDWLRAAHETSTWTTSVCTGSLILGAAGILHGLRATSHWLALEQLPQYGAEPTLERVVIQGKVITAAGVSSGIDMALRLVALELGDEVAQAIQLGIEYDPQPPFDCGSPAKAPAKLVEAMRARSRFLLSGSQAG
jgi:putative intracellular protease/amidase